MKPTQIVIFILVANIFAIDFAISCKSSPTTASGSKAPKVICAGDLIFEENFNNFDFKTWKHDNTLSGGGNGEFQWYTNNRSNSYVKDGVLYIKPTLTADFLGDDNMYKATVAVDGGDENSRCTDSRSYGCERTGTKTNVLNPVRSAKITTVKSFAFTYGTIEIRAQMPVGDWLWPAIWMMPLDSAYGYWVASGEIDIIEGRANKNLQLNGKNIGVNQISSTLHWGPDANYNRFSKTYFEKENSYGYDQDFHIFRLHWTKDSLKFLVDGQTIGTVQPSKSFWDYGKFPANMMNPWRYGTNLAPFDKDFYIIINLAVGGVSYFPDNAVNPTPKPWSNTSAHALTDFWKSKNNWLPTWNQKENDGESAALKVDYIKVWAL